MKNWKLILFFVVAAAAVLLLFSCKKEEIKPNPSNPVEMQDNIRIVAIQQANTDVDTSYLDLYLVYNQHDVQEMYDNTWYFFDQTVPRLRIPNETGIFFDETYTYSASDTTGKVLFSQTKWISQNQSTYGWDNVRVIVMKNNDTIIDIDGTEVQDYQVNFYLH